VFGWCDGALAEHVAVPADRLADKPDAVSFEQAAATPISGLAALQAVRDAGEVTAGQTVVILGASGAVGTFAVQIAKALGAEVTGVCGTRNVDLVASLGADHVIDYTKQDIGHSGQRYDVIVDMAGNRRLSDLRRALAPDGTLVIVGGSGGRWLMGFDRTIRAVLVSPFTRGQRLRAFFSKPTQPRPRRAAGPPQRRQGHTGHRPHLRTARHRRSAGPHRAAPHPGQDRHRRVTHIGLTVDRPDILAGADTIEPADGTAVSPRRAALIAGIGYLIIFVLAIFANFFVVEGLVVPGDATATVDNITGSEGCSAAASSRSRSCSSSTS
jgi:hypothetical protein